MRLPNTELPAWKFVGILTGMIIVVLVLVLGIYRVTPVISYVLMGDSKEWNAIRVEYQVCGYEERNEKQLWVCHTEYRWVKRGEVYR